MFKNIASQKVAVFAWDTISNVAKTGDAANISAQISKDCGASAATDDVNPTELDAADHPGVYFFDMLQEETNADMVIVTPVSATDNIILRPVTIYTRTVMRGTDGANVVVPDAAGVAAGLVGGLNNITTAQVNTEVDAALNTAIPGAPTADSINDYLQRLKYVLVNLMAITEASGNVVGYKDDDTTPAYTVAAAFTTAAGVTTRKRLE